jgi:fucose 4-O-acetylase-like acetyltransferase
MNNENNFRKSNRLFFLDNLKTFIIFLVVLYHAGWVYERSGILSSVWIVNDPSKNDLSGILNIIVDLFMMQTLFFISGYFVPLSIKTKTVWDFIKSRFKRLMIPWIISVLTLIPLYKVIFLYTRNLPQDNFSSYFHFTGGVLINQGWLWFLPVLFLFNIVYLSLTKLIHVELKINIKAAFIITFIIGFLYSLCMSIFKLEGWTKTILLDFQNERLLIYFMIFLLGSLCQKLNIFERNPAKKKLYFLISFTIWIPVCVYIFLLINYIFNPGKYILSEISDGVLFLLSLQISMLSLMYIVINTFRFYANKERKLLRILSDNSYGIYIIHFVIIGAIATLLLNTNITSIARYVITAISAFLISNLIISFYREIIKTLWNKKFHKI